MDNHTRTQTTHTRPNNDARVGTFTFIAGIVAGVMFAGFIAGSEYHPLWYSLSAAAAAAGIMFVWRVWEHDQRAFTSRESMQETGQATYQPENVRAGVIINNGKTMRLGKYNLTIEEWRRLSIALFRNDCRFIRDVVAGANVFTNITATWPQIESEFERMGIVKNKKLTDDGYHFFYRFTASISSPPPQNGTP